MSEVNAFQNQIKEVNMLSKSQIKEVKINNIKIKAISQERKGYFQMERE